MAPLGVHGLAKKLVAEHSERAVDILVSCCDESRIYDEIVRCITSPGGNEALNSRNNVSITLTPHSPMSPVGSQHSGSSRPSYRFQQHSTPISRPLAPLSPPRTASSVTSHSSREGAVVGEWVLFFSYQGGHVDECPARMRIAQIEHSVIRQDIIGKRHFQGDMAQIKPCFVSVTRSTTPHILEKVQTYCSIQLEWRRPHSGRTHRTTFYIVSGEALDTDVLLGYQDSEAGASGDPTVPASQSQRGHDFMYQEHFQNIQPPAPTPPSQSFHRSDHIYEESVHRTPVQQHGHFPQQQPEHVFMDGLLAQQQTRVAAMEDTRHSQNSPTTTIVNSRPLRTEHPQPLRHSPVPTVPAHSGDQTTGSEDRIRLNLLWDKTPMNVWLDMSASGEAFFNAFQQLAEKRQKVFERADVIIYLKTDKQTPDSDAYPLALDEVELQTDWETTVSWLRDNLRDAPPHLIGRVETDEG